MTNTRETYLQEMKGIGQELGLPPDNLLYDAPGSDQVARSIMCHLADSENMKMVVSQHGSELRAKWGDEEYGLTVRLLASHSENESVWAKHVIDKYSPELNSPTSSKPLELTAEEISILYENAPADGTWGKLE